MAGAKSAGYRLATYKSSDGPRAGRPKRRTFTAEYKLRILEEYENAESPRDRAALLRREGIYTSTISEWRRARDAAAPAAIPESRPGRPARDAAHLFERRTNHRRRPR